MIREKRGAFRQKYLRDKNMYFFLMTGPVQKIGIKERSGTPYQVEKSVNF